MSKFYQCDHCLKQAHSWGETVTTGWFRVKYIGILGGEADLCGFACLKAHIAKLEEAHNRPAKLVGFTQGEPDDVP